ncbi:hypothetical protein J6590_028210 [Homalodisca vitripennis]|nr:hypothetical protein J6590_028210 [Homalodisca vitripennis]
MILQLLTPFLLGTITDIERATQQLKALPKEAFQKCFREESIQYKVDGTDKMCNGQDLNKRYSNSDPKFNDLDR